MKKIIKMLAVVSLFTTIFSKNYISSYAETHNDNQDDYETYSINGKEISVSSALPKEEKSLLFEMVKEIPTINPKGVVVEVTETETIFTEKAKDSKRQNELNSVISTDKLKLRIIKSDISTSTEAKYSIQAIAIWYTSPLIKSNDQFALSWGGDFAVYSYSSVAYWKSGGSGILTTSSLSNIDANKGIAYQYPCGLSGGGITFDPWYIQIDASLKRAKGSGNNSANVVAKYAHKTSGLGSISVSFSGTGISFTATAGATYDTAQPASIVINY